MCPSRVSVCRKQASTQHFPTTLTKLTLPSSLSTSTPGNVLVHPFLRSFDPSPTFAHLARPFTESTWELQVNDTWHILPDTGIHPLRDSSRSPSMHPGPGTFLLPCHPGTIDTLANGRDPAAWLVLLTYYLPAVTSSALSGITSQPEPNPGCLRSARKGRHDVEVVPWV